MRVIGEALLPWARGATGYLGTLRFHDAEAETTLVVTLWSTREALDESRAAVDRMTPLAAEASGAEIVSVEHFELTLVDLPVPLDRVP